MIVIGIHPLIHGLSLLNDCCSQLNLPTLQSRLQYFSISFLHNIYYIIIPPLISTITVISTVFLLPEVIICHYFHLNQPLTLGDIPFFVNSVFWWSSVPLCILNDSNHKSFGILCSILFLLMIHCIR